MGELGTCEILRQLHSAATVKRGRVRGAEPIPLDALSTISLVSEAAMNVNCMLLEQFVEDLGLRRRRDGARGMRFMTARGALVVLVLDYEDADERGQLVFAEFGRVRLSAAFIADDVAFVRDARVVLCPLSSANDRILAMTSLHVVPYRPHGGPDRRALPPVA